MDWWQALILGFVQGLTEFLPVSSSGHLVLFREIVGADPDGFLDFTVAVHFATVLSTLVVFRKAIWSLLKGLFKFTYNDQTDYVLKIIVSMIPIAVVGLFFKDSVEALFRERLSTVAVCLLITALLLFISDKFTVFNRKDSIQAPPQYRNGISYWQALTVGIGQSFAVAPGLSRSGTTIATGLISGVKRNVMAQFSFLMVLVPIVGEQLLELLQLVGAPASASPGVGATPVLVGGLAAFLSGILACTLMISIVRKANLSWFSLYCVVIAILIFIFL